MPRINAVGVPLLKLGRDITLTPETWVSVDPSTFTPELGAEYENLRMRGLISLHPDDRVAPVPAQDTPPPPADDPGVTKDEKPRRGR